MTKKKSGVLKRILKILGLTVAIVVILLVALVYSLRFPAVQQYITSKALSFYHSKVDAHASIDRLYVDFPSNITIEKLYLEDQEGDTLVYVNYLSVQTDLWALIDNRLHLSDISLDGLKANILRPDSTFNFQFIIDGFATNQSTSSGNSQFDFTIGEVGLSKLDVVYDDAYAGITTSGNIGELAVEFAAFDINKPAIDISTIALKKAKANLRIYEGRSNSQVSNAKSEEADFKLSGRELTLDDVDFKLEIEPSNIRLNHQVGHLGLVVDQLDINENIYLAEEIILRDAFVSIDQFSKGQQSDTASASMEAVIKLLAGAKRADIENSSFKFYDHSDSVTKGFDPKHLWIQKLNGSLAETYFENGNLRGEINQLSAFERSGLQLKNLQGDWLFESNRSKISGLVLELNNTQVYGDLAASYPSIASLAENPAAAEVNLKLNESLIDTDDILTFNPDLRQQFQILQPFHLFKIISEIKGTIDQLQIDTLYVAGLKQTSLGLTGTIKGLSDPMQGEYNFENINLNTGANDILQLAGNKIPANINIPKSIQANVSYKGSLADMNSGGVFKTSLGKINYQLNLKLLPDSVYAYTGNLDIQQLQLGKLISNEKLGELTLNGLVDGKGFDLQHLDTKIKGFIKKLDYNNYAYQNVDINGRIQDKRFDGLLAMSDENLDFNFNGLVNFRDSIPTYNFSLDLRRANLQELNFSKDLLKIRAKVNSDISAKNIETLNGNLVIDDLTIAKGDEIYQLDSMSLNAKSENALTELSFKSSVVDANFKGNFKLNTLPEVVEQHLQRYLSDSTELKDLAPQEFVFNIDFKNPGFFTNVVVPGLNEFEPGIIEGKYNSEEWLIDVGMNFRKVDYKGTIIDSLGIQLVSDKESLNFTAGIDRLIAASSEFNNIRLFGTIEGDRIKADFKILDEKGKDRYHIGGTLSEAQEHYVFELIPDEFILNYDSWEVHPDNQFELHDDYFWVSNVAISNNGQQITVDSKIRNEQDTTLVTNFDQFDLSFLGKFKETENYVLGGVINGNVDYYINRGSLKANLKINQFSYKGDTLGNIDLLAQNIDSKTSLDLGIKSRRNDLSVKGDIIQTDKTELDLDAKINRLDVATVQAYTANEISELDGNLTGQFKVTGTVDNPDIKGKVDFNDIAFKVNYIGAKYFINDETINFTRNGLAFNNFKIADEASNMLNLDGTINSENYSDYEFKLKLSANNFKVLNTNEKDNQLVYGKLAINADADLTGDLNNPKVRVDLGIANGSDVTYIIPEEEISVAERRGVVEFFDQDIENDDFFGEEIVQESDSLDVWIKGIDLRANIDVNSTSTFNIIIDPITQDKLSVSGNADLTLGMRPTGDMTLTGRYEVSDGSYDLNFYSLVKRKFDIRPGSYLLWTGDPLNARLDVSAIYTVRAAPVNTDFRRKVPFDVFLDINGELLTPDISFRLALAEQGAAPISVQSWLNGVNQQEAVLNRQVFSLLLFKTFMTSDFSSGGGDNNLAQSTARNSASRILSNQLNRLGSKIKGLELSFDLQSYQDYSENGGQEGRTELELGLSKQFFDDRVIVKVAGNFDLEGGESQQKSVSDFAGDIKIEYKLTEDGRFRLVGFRQNEFDNLLQGEIAKTGVGIIFVRDYNTLKELFKKSEEVSDEE